MATFMNMDMFGSMVRNSIMGVYESSDEDQRKAQALDEQLNKAYAENLYDYLAGGEVLVGDRTSKVEAWCLSWSMNTVLDWAPSPPWLQEEFQNSPISEITFLTDSLSLKMWFNQNILQAWKRAPR